MRQHLLMPVRLFGPVTANQPQAWRSQTDPIRLLDGCNQRQPWLLESAHLERPAPLSENGGRRLN
jgi:hypothetical protein